MSPDHAPAGFGAGRVELPFDPEREPLDVVRIMGALREQGRLDRRPTSTRSSSSGSCDRATTGTSPPTTSSAHIVGAWSHA